MKKLYTLLVFSLLLTAIPATSLASETNTQRYKKTFTITAYYSPLPDQSYYYTGNYHSEIRLNGRGTNGASGKEVYPGMIAAPKEYPFGTKMDIPGVGVVGVWDRGGAIKVANGKNLKHDRLDIWMGKGEEGLARALAWGRRNVEVEVIGFDPSVIESVNLSSISKSGKQVKKPKYGQNTFSKDVYYNSKGENVRKLQTLLKQYGYFTHPITGFYGDVTREAVIAFQVHYGIIDSRDDFGAGHFGRNSRYVIDKVVAGETVESFSKPQSNKVEVPAIDEDKNAPFYRPLNEEENSDYVKQLEGELKTLGFLLREPQSQYDKVTMHAIFKFQEKFNLVSSESDAAAGYLGPQTRQKLNEVVTSRNQFLANLK